MRSLNRQSSAAILLAGQRVSFWEFLGNAVVAYVVAILAMLLGGPLGALACMLIGTATTALFVYGLLLFSLQRPSAALVIIALLAVLHLSLLKARVPAGLFWLAWSNEGAHWMSDRGL
jgi:hypothetical protein